MNPLFLTDAPIEAYVPHRSSMCLLDRVVEVGDEHVVAEVTVPGDGLFVRDGAVPAWVGIEYMAQTVAAWAGARAQRDGASPRLGFLLGSRRYDASVPQFLSGDTLRVHARCELIGENGLGMFECRIEHGERELARARLSVFEPPEGADFLNNNMNKTSHD